MTATSTDILLEACGAVSFAVDDTTFMAAVRLIAATDDESASDIYTRDATYTLAVEAEVAR